jgi:hypothetical protein
VSKEQKSNKEAKKQPLLNKKDKKAAKLVKKVSRDAAKPFTMPKD